jgi:hypothetical protein
MAAMCELRVTIPRFNILCCKTKLYIRKYKNQSKTKLAAPVTPYRNSWIEIYF